MSRKREEKRENKRELARHLGVDASEVPDDLRAHARVTEPSLSLALHGDRVKRGLLTRAGPLAVHAALYVVDGGGPRLARLVSARGKLGEGAVALADVTQQGDERVRYTRPGSFVLVALLTEGADAAAQAAHVAALSDARALRVVVDGAARALSDEAVKRAAAPVCIAAVVAGASGASASPAGAALTFAASALVCVPAAHRVHETVRLPLVDGDRLRATLVVDLRV
jgi:hypothetical protein